MSQNEKMVPKPYSMKPSQVKWVERFASELHLATGEKKSASKVVREAVDFYRAAMEADGVVKARKVKK